MDRRRAAGALLALAACVACSTAAPTASNQTALDLYNGATEGCFYNFQHYGEGDRIMTNEPCLNCTCHNRMLMCYLRVCPFTKPIGQDCTVEKRADQCCPIVTCPDVPVDLLTSTSTSSPAEYGATGVANQDRYGCSINGRYFPEGSKVPPTPNKPCEHCYCIRNMTTCVMQECTLHVDGCIPIYHKDVCCPVRYSCDHPEDEIPLLDDMTTTVRPTPGFLLTTTTLSPVTQVSQDCVHDDEIFADGALIKTEKACEHCYCMKGDIVCVVQECGTPMENEGKNCTSLPPRHGQCCPDTYICEGDDVSTDQPNEQTTIDITKISSTTPPRRAGVEGSGYRNEPDETYTDIPIFDLETEGSGEEQATVSLNEPDIFTPDKQTPDLADEMFLTTSKLPESKPFTSIPELGIDQTLNPKLPEEDNKSEISGIDESTIYESNFATEPTKADTSEKENETFDFENKDIESTHVDDRDRKVTEVISATTISFTDDDSSSSSDRITSRDDQAIVTTEPSFRKEDNYFSVADVTTQKQINLETTESEHYSDIEIMKEDINTKIDTTTKLEDDELKLASVEPNNVEDTISKQTTPEISQLNFNISTSTESQSDRKETTVQYFSSSTITTDFTETTSVNPKENEVAEHVSPIDESGRIPGEGDCLLNGITYKNNTSLPSVSKCHTSCKCISSIVKCDPIMCSPPPEYDNCQPIYDSAESCCPTYICDQSKETKLPESHSQMAATESSNPIQSNKCNGNECTVSEENQSLPNQPQPCLSENCAHVLDEKHPELPDCATGGCGTTDENSVPQTKPKEMCSDGKCILSTQNNLPCNEETGCQVAAVKPCEGEDCVEHQEAIPEKNNIDDSLETECANDSCRRKESPNLTLTHSCTGNQCESSPENEIQETTSKITENLNHEDISTPSISFSELNTVEPTTGMINVLEQKTTFYETSSSKIDINDIPEVATKFPEELPDTDNSATKQSDIVTSARPEIDEGPQEHGITTKTSTKSPDSSNENEYSTTLSHNLLTEPTIAEENVDSKKVQESVVDKEKDIMIQTQIPDIVTVPTSKFELTEKRTTLLPDILTSTQKHIVYEHGQDTSPTETTDVTSAIIDSEKYYTESYKSDSPVNQENNLSTTSKPDATSSILFDEFSTILPEVNEPIEKTTIAPLKTSDKTEQYIDTTNVPTSVNLSFDQERVTTEYTKEYELPQYGPTEQTLDYTMREKTTSQIDENEFTEAHNKINVIPVTQNDLKQQLTTESPELYITKEVISNKTDSDEEQLYTKLPVTELLYETTKSPGHDFMESLNGRGTDLPEQINKEEKLQTEKSQLHITDTELTTPKEIPFGLGQTQTESSNSDSTDITFDTSQKIFEENEVTKISQQMTTESTKIFTTESTFITSDKDQEDTTNLNQGVGDTDKTVFISGEKITTENGQSLNHHLSTIEGNKGTESFSNSQEYTTQTPLILQTDESLGISDDKQHQEHIPDYHKDEHSTSSLYPETEITTELYPDNFKDVSIKPEQKGTKEETETKPSELPSENLTTYTPHDSSLATMLPSTSSENIMHTSISEEKVTQSALPITESILLESLPTESLKDLTTPVSISHEQTVTTKQQISEEVTTIRELLTEGTEKTSVVSSISDNRDDSSTILTTGEEKYGITTVLPEILREDPHKEKDKGTTLSNDVDKNTIRYDTETSTSSITEVETSTDNLFEATIQDLEEKTSISENLDAAQSYTKSPDTFTVQENVDDHNVVKYTEIPYISTTSYTDESETQSNEEPDYSSKASTTTKEMPYHHVAEEEQTEKQDYTTVKSPKLDENAGTELMTEIYEKNTESDDNVKITSIPEKITTKPIELVSEKESSTLSVEYTEKLTETPETLYTVESTSKLPEITVQETSDASKLQTLSAETQEGKVTDKPSINIIDYGTEETSNIIEQENDNAEKLSTEKFAVKDLSTELPQIVTETIYENEYTHYNVPDKESGVLEILDSKLQDRTTEKTAIVADATEISVSVETSSYLPEISTVDKFAAAVTEEIHTDQNTEMSETSANEAAATTDIESSPVTVIPVLHNTEKSFDVLEDHIGKVTESAINEDTDESSKITEKIIESTFKPIITDSETSTEVPDLYTTQHVESGTVDDTTLKTSTHVTTLLHTVKMESSTQSEKDETTSEKELLESENVTVGGESKTTYVPESYTKLPKIEKVITTTFTPELDITTLRENEQVFIQNLDGLNTTVSENSITQKVESGTQLPITSSSDSLSTEELHVTVDQMYITISPEPHEYTTESSSHVVHDVTVDNQTTQTELPELLIISQDSTKNAFDEKDITTILDSNLVTEKSKVATQQDAEVSVEISTESDRLESKPITGTSDFPEYSKGTTDAKYGYTESTQTFVELEEHTHKSAQDATPEVYHDVEITTLKSELGDITTDKQISLGEDSQTESIIKEVKDTTQKDTKSTTPISDYEGLGIFHTTESEYKTSEPPIKLTTSSILYAGNENDVTKHLPTIDNEETSTAVPVVPTVIYEKQETSKLEEQSTPVSYIEKESNQASGQPHETTLPEEEFIPTVTKFTTKIADDITTLAPSHFDKFTRPEDKPTELSSTSAPDLQKPGLNEILPTDDIPSTDEDGNFPPTGTSGYGQEPDYVEEDQAFGPGTCRYGGKVYVSAQQIPRDDPCDFCFCFRSDIICLQQSCPPPIHGCHEEPIQGFCCPRYECPVSMATTLNITTTTTTTTTTLPPHFLPHAYKGAAQRRGCQIKGHTYKVGEIVRASSGPCLHCTCGGDGQMKCDPKACTPEPMLRQMIAAAVSAKRRR